MSSTEATSQRSSRGSSSTSPLICMQRPERSVQQQPSSSPFTPFLRRQDCWRSMTSPFAPRVRHSALFLQLLALLLLSLQRISARPATAAVEGQALRFDNRRGLLVNGAEGSSSDAMISHETSHRLEAMLSSSYLKGSDIIGAREVERPVQMVYLRPPMRKRVARSFGFLHTLPIDADGRLLLRAGRNAGEKHLYHIQTIEDLPVLRFG